MKKIISFLLLIIIFTLCGCNNNNKDLEALFREHYEKRQMAFAIENDLYQDYQCDVAFLGDSLTEGYDLITHYPQYTAANRGIAGDTTIGLENRLKVSLFDLKPKVAVMLIGANNMDSMLDNYERILISFTNNVPNTKIVILSLTSMSGEWGKKNQLAVQNNVKIKELAQKYSFEYVDLFSALLNTETGEILSEYTTDGGHLTEKGYDVLTANITPAIEKQLAVWQLEN